MHKKSCLIPIVMCPKDADEVQQYRPWSDCCSSFRSSQIWFYRVCSDLSVQTLRIITVIWLIDSRGYFMWKVNPEWQSFTHFCSYLLWYRHCNSCMPDRNYHVEGVVKWFSWHNKLKLRSFCNVSINGKWHLNLLPNVVILTLTKRTELQCWRQV